MNESTSAKCVLLARDENECVRQSDILEEISRLEYSPIYFLHPNTDKQSKEASMLPFFTSEDEFKSLKEFIIDMIITRVNKLVQKKRELIKEIREGITK